MIIQWIKYKDYYYNKLSYGYWVQYDKFGVKVDDGITPEEMSKVIIDNAEVVDNPNFEKELTYPRFFISQTHCIYFYISTKERLILMPNGKVSLSTDSTTIPNECLEIKGVDKLALKNFLRRIPS